MREAVPLVRVSTAFLVIMVCVVTCQISTNRLEPSHQRRHISSPRRRVDRRSAPSSETLKPAAETDGEDDVRRRGSATDEELLARWRWRWNSTCALRCTESRIHSEIRRMIDVDEVKLIEYKLLFPHYNATPLISNWTTYKAESWARTSTRHGQTLLSLSFNYGILSMMTLSVGTASLDVPLEDQPYGCIRDLTEAEQHDVVLRLMLRDFREESVAMVTGEARLCHEAIVGENGYARFIDVCCYEDADTAAVICRPDVVNVWLRLLQLILSFIRFGILLFGPLLFASSVVSISRKKFPYMVRLKDPLMKTVVFQQNGPDPDTTFEPKHRLDLRAVDGFPKLRSSVTDVPLGVQVPVRICQYDIEVSYNRTLSENSVPVGFWRTIFGAVFRCKMRNVGPFRECCVSDMCGPLGRISKDGRPGAQWITLWSKVGLTLMVILIPTPYYLRLYVFYRFEYDEVSARKEAIARLGLWEQFSNNPLHYLTPTHPIFLCVYATYFLTAALIGFTARGENKGAFLRILTGAFDDLTCLPWTLVLHVLVSNIIWPFKQFGVIGCLVAVIYWPLAIPLTVFLCAFYSLPTVYLTVRMMFYSRSNFLLVAKKRGRIRPYRARKQSENSVKFFEVERFLKRTLSVDVPPDETSDDLDTSDLDYQSMTLKRTVSDAVSLASSMAMGFERHWRKCFTHLLTSALCVAALCSTLVVLSECVGCLVEVALFTLMGVIVNAGVLLKYVALVILLVVYSYDCFNDVQKNYLKLNKTLFGEVKGRIKDLDLVTSQPSDLQENQGFKSQELNEQASYEEPDDMVPHHPTHWLINDLVLFVDNEDMPRIPRKLFDEVCQIRVAGVPGPVHQGHLLALKRFSKIVLFVSFVFMVVLSFSETYKISSTNQMLATLAGGFLPLILRTFMGDGEPELELNTLSFRSKLDEVIKNFYQAWPIYDFPFEVASPNPDKAPPEDDLKTGNEFPSTIPRDEISRSRQEESESGISRAEQGRQTVTFMQEKSTKVEVDILIELPETEGWTDLRRGIL